MTTRIPYGGGMLAVFATIVLLMPAHRLAAAPLTDTVGATQAAQDGAHISPGALIREFTAPSRA
ncbi:MAG TPA: hypothetical protein VG248_14220 [Caulobacteraceae bacterium]|nr:hypothetical protein [Caulobacteraceae bacterium]